MGSRATALTPSLVAVTKKYKYKTVLNLKGFKSDSPHPSLVEVTKKCKYKNVLNLNGFKGDSPHPFLGSSYQGTQKFSFKEELFQ